MHPPPVILVAPDTPASWRALARFATVVETRRAARYRHTARRRAFRLGCILARFAAALAAGEPLRRTGLVPRANRRPLHRSFAAQRRQALSITHGGGWVLAAATPSVLGRRVGVDVERADRAVPPRLASRLPSLGETSAADTVLRWCVTEAALKADGRGMPGLRHLEVRKPRGPLWLLYVAAPPYHHIRAQRLAGQRRVMAVALATPGPVSSGDD